MEMETCGVWRSVRVSDWTIPDLIGELDNDSVVLTDQQERPGQFTVVSDDASQPTVGLSPGVVGGLQVGRQLEEAGHSRRVLARPITGMSARRSSLA